MRARKALGVVLVWLGLLLGLIALDAWVAPVTNREWNRRFFEQMLAIDAALFVSWRIVRMAQVPAGRAHAPRIRAGAWIARGLGWVACTRLMVVVYLLVVGNTVYLTKELALGLELGAPLSFALTRSWQLWFVPFDVGGVLAVVVISALLLAGQRGAPVLRGAEVGPLRKRLGACAVIYATVTAIVLPLHRDVAPWIRSLGGVLIYECGRYVSPEDQRLVATLLCASVTVLALTAYLLLGPAARREEQELTGRAEAAGEDDGIGGLDLE